MKNQIKKQQLTTTNYEKRFDSFDEMIKEVQSIHPILFEIFGYKDEEEATPVTALIDILNYSGEHIPNVIERKNLPFSFSISSNRAYIKTNKYISLKWKFSYNKDKPITDIYATVSIFAKDENSDEIISALNILNNSNEWKVVKDRKDQ